MCSSLTRVVALLACILVLSPVVNQAVGADERQLFGLYDKAAREAFASEVKLAESKMDFRCHIGNGVPEEYKSGYLTGLNVQGSYFDGIWETLKENHAAIAACMKDTYSSVTIDFHVPATTGRAFFSNPSKGLPTCKFTRAGAEVLRSTNLEECLKDALVNMKFPEISAHVVATYNFEGCPSDYAKRVEEYQKRVVFPVE